MSMRLLNYHTFTRVPLVDIRDQVHPVQAHKTDCLSCILVDLSRSSNPFSLTQLHRLRTMKPAVPYLQNSFKVASLATNRCLATNQVAIKCDRLCCEDFLFQLTYFNMKNMSAEIDCEFPRLTASEHPENTSRLRSAGMQIMGIIADS